MPTRLLKESIWTSPNLNQCSQAAERHFYRLLPLADDWGCFEATPDVVKGRCYPLQLATRSIDIEKWHNELQDRRLLLLWTASGRTFAQFTSWDRHNASLAERHSPTTPCPPWLLNKSGFDSRLATETLHAFELIAKVLHQQESSCSKTTYREIHEKTKCSMSTIAKFFKNRDLQERYTSLHLATDATPKNPNPNPISNIPIGILPSECVAPKKELPRDPYWDAMVATWGEPVTRAEKSRFGKNSREFRECGIDPSEIPIRHARVIKAWKTIPCSAETLLKHWSEFSSPNGNGTGHLDDEEKERLATENEIKRTKAYLDEQTKIRKQNEEAIIP